MTQPWIAALFALFIWWFSTGAILLVVRRADLMGGLSHRMAVFTGLPFLALGMAGAITSLTDTTVAGVYISFCSALAIWGWIELAFLAGVITGPEKRDCPAGLTGAARFYRAWNTVSHHEMALVIGLLFLVVVSKHAPNQVALWTYLILFAARISAKLNLFFGVPRINTEFVPKPLAHIKSYFRRGPITIAFPVSITLLSLAVGCFAERLWTITDPVRDIEFALLTALAGLALLEHWLMVIPLPDAKLWRWMLPAPTLKK